MSTGAIPFNDGPLSDVAINEMGRLVPADDVRMNERIYPFSEFIERVHGCSQADYVVIMIARNKDNNDMT